MVWNLRLQIHIKRICRGFGGGEEGLARSGSLSRIEPGALQ